MQLDKIRQACADATSAARHALLGRFPCNKADQVQPSMVSYAVGLQHDLERQLGIGYRIGKAAGSPARKVCR